MWSCVSYHGPCCSTVWWKKIVVSSGHFLFSLQMWNGAKIPNVANIFRHLNSLNGKISPCLTNCMASDLSSLSGSPLWKRAGLRCFSYAVNIETVSAHFVVLSPTSEYSQGEMYPLFSIFFSIFCTYWLGPWPFELMCAEKCKRLATAGTGLTGRDQLTDWSRTLKMESQDCFGHILDFTGEVPSSFKLHHRNAATLIHDIFLRLRLRFLSL